MVLQTFSEQSVTPHQKQQNRVINNLKLKRYVNKTQRDNQE